MITLKRIFVRQRVKSFFILFFKRRLLYTRSEMEDIYIIGKKEGKKEMLRVIGANIENCQNDMAQKFNEVIKKFDQK
jgi:hypothetical protein